MGKYIKYYDTHLEYDGEKDLLDLPNISWCEQEEDVHYADEDFYRKLYLTFDIVEDGTLVWKHYVTSGSSQDKNFPISYSLDNGNTWTSGDTFTLGVTLGLKILFKANNNILVSFYEQFSSRYAAYNKFEGTASFNVSGNILSLFYNDDFVDKTSINTYAFKYFFKNTKVINAKNLILPTKVSYECYAWMFLNCTLLTTAPELPATTLTYSYSCYYGMFLGCTNLTIAPKLPATTLTNNCYELMFFGCTSLTTAPILPATTLVSYCYERMFAGCTSLTTAPTLPAMTLVDSCYCGMFGGCTSLNYIKALFTTTPNFNDTGNWVLNVAASGTFVKNSAATWNVTGANGIPSGWTVVTADS